ncbi:XRE family transcriptional regulator [Acidithiobacillus sp.]|uniref:helix-turn-helix domain-containing protein n=1 Tax=Acidithiobacillus sp. TaxID=1872118 RepID=UPI00260308BF|nr:XRE family transcriptional regulator [Acidithiobacillus sp.]MDD5279530.1 XRE family transcriptional regulator [Acidithiobacillus sp.]
MTTVGERINERLRELGKKQEWLADESGCAQNTISKLVTGKSEKSRFIPQIAKALGVTSDWLADGIYPKLRVADASGDHRESAPVTDAAGDSLATLDINVVPASKPQCLVPIISWVAAGEFATSQDVKRLNSEDVTDWVRLDQNHHGQYVFGLIIHGDSMEPDFKDGDRIVVDPDAYWESGDYVVIGNGQPNEEATFKQIVKDGPDWYLRPRNPQWPVRRLEVGCRVIGRAIFHQPLGRKL